MQTFLIAFLSAALGSWFGVALCIVILRSCKVIRFEPWAIILKFEDDTPTKEQP